MRGNMPSASPPQKQKSSELLLPKALAALTGRLAVRPRAEAALAPADYVRETAGSGAWAG
ncbi:hypothetical protein GCM10009680_85170 [Streptomyces yatensis]|uniref:Uncharacterized protein n=1 Tax=Streptomyces yatensis TaxID=155177 RepID=A0ABN2JL72_9ACTN